MKHTYFLLLAIVWFTVGVIACLLFTKPKQGAPPNCAAERLSGEQVAYVNYKKAVGKWAYENGVDINFDAIDSLYYYPNGQPGDTIAITRGQLASVTVFEADNK